jgi:hypothetical protein
VHFLLPTEKRRKKNKRVSYRRKEITLFNRYMASGPSHPSNLNTTCMTLDSRALCAVCGALAIGKKRLTLKISFNFFFNAFRTKFRCIHLFILQR